MGMRKRSWIVGAVTIVALIAGAIATKGIWRPDGAVAQAPIGAGRLVPVEVATAVKKRFPVRLDLLGSVTPIASVAVKPRIDSEIVAVHFRDGAMVQQGDKLFTLDGRAIEAQVRQAQGQLARDQASLDGAELDVKRNTDLVARGAGPITNLQNANTQAGTFRGAIKADQGLLENLNVQLGYAEIRAAITGRVSMAALKVGNFVRQADLAPLATIVQTAPVYVTFAVPQRNLPELRQALTQETATIEAVVPGDGRRASGQVTMIENSVDSTTGMVPVRATMPNTDEVLWPGTLVNVQLTLRDEQAVAVPSTAVQVSQTGTFVFVIDNGAAAVRPVKVARVVGTTSILESGLDGGETVVTDGQLLLTTGTRVSMRAPKAGA